jgi:CheY-like chemotaxis protein
MVLQKFMKEFGFETLEAESGIEAIWLLKRTPDIDLITVDFNMPKMNGIQFARLVREKPELNNIPIIMITSEEQRQAEAHEAGVDEFLVKPFDKTKVEEKLNVLGIDPGKPKAPVSPESDEASLEPEGEP